MAALNGWENFYVIVGSSAGALIGLQFVVMTLIANMPMTTGLAQAGDAPAHNKLRPARLPGVTKLALADAQAGTNAKAVGAIPQLNLGVYVTKDLYPTTAVPPGAPPNTSIITTNWNRSTASGVAPAAARPGIGAAWASSSCSR